MFVNTVYVTNSKSVLSLPEYKQLTNVVIIKMIYDVNQIAYSYLANSVHNSLYYVANCPNLGHK